MIIVMKFSVMLDKVIGIVNKKALNLMANTNNPFMTFSVKGKVVLFAGSWKLLKKVKRLVAVQRIMIADTGIEMYWNKVTRLSGK